MERVSGAIGRRLTLSRTPSRSGGRAIFLVILVIMQKQVLAGVGILIVVALLVWAYFWGVEKDEIKEPYRTSLTGEYVCLEKEDGTKKDSTQCAQGLKLEDGTLYALDFMLMSQIAPQLVSGDRISAAGVITDVRRMNSITWQDYNVAGIFSVTSILK